MKSSIQKWGNSQAIRIPKAALELANLHGNDRVQITVEDERIIIARETPTKKKTLKERPAEYNGTYTFEEWETGGSVGKEIF